MKNILSFIFFMCGAFVTKAQTAEKVINNVKSKLEKVNDYEARGKMKTNVIFIKAPIANVKVYYKKPNKLRINNENGISFIPKGSVNINLNNIFINTTGFDIIDVGKETGTNLRIIKLLPKDDNAEVVLSTLYIDEALSLIKKAKTITFDYDDGTKKTEPADKMKNKKGKVEIVYSGYSINKGVPDSVFN